MVVYIREAHASDVWPIGLSAGKIIPRHQNLAQRIAAAQTLRQDYHLELDLWVDDMQDGVVDIMAGWPTRFWIMERGKFLHIAHPDRADFAFGELERYIA